jgi:hypothetical protein
MYMRSRNVVRKNAPSCIVGGGTLSWKMQSETLLFLMGLQYSSLQSVERLETRVLEDFVIQTQLV